MRTTPTNRIASTRPWWQRSACRQMRGRGARSATSRRHTDKSPKRRRQDAPQSTERKPVRKQGKYRTHRQVPEQMEHEARPASSWKIESGSVGTTRTPNAGKTSAYVPAPGGDSCRGVSMEPFRECETALTKASILQNPAFTSPSCAKLQALIFCHTSKNTRKPARLQWVTPLVVQAEAERGCRDTQPRRRP